VVGGKVPSRCVPVELRGVFLSRAGFFTQVPYRSCATLQTPWTCFSAARVCWFKKESGHGKKEKEKARVESGEWRVESGEWRVTVLGRVVGNNKTSKKTDDNDDNDNNNNDNNYNDIVNVTIYTRNGPLQEANNQRQGRNRPVSRTHHQPKKKARSMQPKPLDP